MKLEKDKHKGDVGIIPYRGDGSLVQYPPSEFLNRIRLSRDADICHESLEGTSLKTGDRLRLRGDDSSMKWAAVALADLSAQSSQIFNILRVYGEFVARSVWRRAFGMGPSVEGSRTGVDNTVNFWAGEIGRQRHVQGEIDNGARGGSRGEIGRSSTGSVIAGACGGEGMLIRRRDGHLVLRPRPEAHRGRHLFPTMPGRPCDIGNPVHDVQQEFACAK